MLKRKRGDGMATGFVWHELYMWHNTGNWAQVFAPGLTIQPGEHAENPETKRRLRNLVEVSGLIDHLEEEPASFLRRVVQANAGEHQESAPANRARLERSDYLSHLGFSSP